MSRRGFVTASPRPASPWRPHNRCLASVSTVSAPDAAVGAYSTCRDTNRSAAPGADTPPPLPASSHSRAPAAPPLPSSSSPRGVKYVFGNSASEDAQFYEALVDRPQLKYILTPHEGPGAAMAAGYIKASGEPAIVMQAGVGRHGERHGPDVQRVQGADAARGLLLSHRPVAACRARRLRGGRQPGADRPAIHQVHLAGAPRRHDPGDRAPRLQGGVDAALWALLHLLAFRLQQRARAHRDHRAEPFRSAHAGAAQSRRSRARRQASGRSADAAAWSSATRSTRPRRWPRR